MSRVTDPNDRKKLEAKSRRIFLRICFMVMLVFIAMLLATVVLLPKMWRSSDDGRGPCPTEQDGSAGAANATLLCNDHGSCDGQHSHCVCLFSMYDGASCDSLSLGFCFGAPAAVCAVLWFCNLARILFCNQQRPHPTPAEMDALYDEMLGLFVRPKDLPAAAAASPSKRPRRNSRRPRGSFPLSRSWTGARGAVLVLIRRAG